MTASAPSTIRRHKSKARLYPEELSESVTLEMVCIPSGKFMMGAPENEKDAEDAERPQHLVTVPAFFMGRYPITQAQYKAVMGINPSNFKDKPEIDRRNLERELSDIGMIETSRLKDKPDSDRRPVENVTWEDANKFCKQLSDRTNRDYRLPSEAQWEYACRADKKTPFHFGKTISTELANYDGNSTYANGEKGVYRGKTTPVEYFGIANEFGLCDMHGNVWEWCLDTWHSNYDGAPTNGSAWIEVNETSHLLRGGSCISNPLYCRSAYRLLNSRTNNYDPIGFRVISSAPYLS